jgi:hypothetical protein
MHGLAIGAGLLVVVFALVLAYGVRRMKPQIPGYASQRMCPSCGLITPRAKAACLECGKVLIPVVGEGRG